MTPLRKPLLRAERLFLGLPDSWQALIARLGLGRGLLQLRRYLDKDIQLAKFPAPVRRKIIRRQILRYLGGDAVESYRGGFYPFLAKGKPWSCYPDIMADQGLAPKETLYPVLKRRPRPAQAVPVPAVLHIHAYYLDGLDEVIQILCGNTSQPDLVVTGPEANRAAALDMLKAYPGQARFVSCANIGRDILPFLRLLPQLTAAYRLIGHIHLKQSNWVGGADFVRLWRLHLLSATIGNLDQGLRTVDDILADFAARQGRVALYLPHVMAPISWNGNREIARPIFAALTDQPLPERLLFPVGTMFWAEAGYLARFSQIDLPWEELVPEPIAGDGTVLHAIERLFGAVAFAEGAPIVIVPPDQTPYVMSLPLAREITRLTRS